MILHPILQVLEGIGGAGTFIAMMFLIIWMSGTPGFEERDDSIETVSLLVREPAQVPSWPGRRLPVSDYQACRDEYIRTGDREWLELALAELS